MRDKKVNQLELLNENSLVGVKTTKMEGRVLHTPYGEMIDYCNTNYLGFDYLPEIHERGAECAREWGSLFGLSRLEADPVIYTDLEKRISKWLNAKETILSHTITITGFSVMPKLAGQGVILADSKVHTVVYEACRLAKAHGATLDRFQHQDLNDLERKLAQYRDVHPKLIAVDGVYSISSEKAPLREMAALCEKYNAFLYVDDAHGFGILGRQIDSEDFYGKGGRGVVDHFDVPMNRIFYVSSFAKAFCVQYAFIAVPHAYNEMLRENCMQYIFSAPPAPYNIGVMQSALDVNEREGDRRRQQLLMLTKRFVHGLQERGISFLNTSYFPIVFWKIGDLELMARVAKAMYTKGVIAGLRAYPVVPSNECGVRFGLTALHTEAQIDYTLNVIDQLLAEFPMIHRLSAAG